ncbi:MAG: hypothetical protein J07HR59_01619 [Halorubrum sp. J07HR59]|jgi:hypothetical protein|nr:MAG: hypothetical protein J07HR59_01619 [Halorubrum sp. J07HR59]
MSTVARTTTFRRLTITVDIDCVCYFPLFPCLETWGRTRDPQIGAGAGNHLGNTHSHETLSRKGYY